MALDKAIENGKEHRKMYYGAKAVSCSCRNHGTCEWCLNNRMYQATKENEKALDKMREWEYNGDRK